MRKEELLYKKNDAIDKMVWYARVVMTDEDLKKFSIPQLQAMCEIMEKAEREREKHDPFYTLSACEVVQKSSGRIAYFEDEGEIHEETEKECLEGAARTIYLDYKSKVIF